MSRLTYGLHRAEHMPLERLNLSAEQAVCHANIRLQAEACARWGQFVSACATCDGFFFRGKEVAVIGGGNSAIEEAPHLINHTGKVTLVHHRDSLPGERIMQDRLLRTPKIAVVWDSVVEGVFVAGMGCMAALETERWSGRPRAGRRRPWRHQPGGVVIRP